MKRKNIVTLSIFVLTPIILGMLVGFITKGSVDYNTLIKPFFAPPGWIFPIVWTFLYLLMGVSSYLIYQSNSPLKRSALIVYFIQLFVNLLWSIIFFVWSLRLFALFWILLLITLVILMIVMFFRIDKLSARLQIPYLLWISFAAVLNLFFYLLN